MSTDFEKEFNDFIAEAQEKLNAQRAIVRKEIEKLEKLSSELELPVNLNIGSDVLTFIPERTSSKIDFTKGSRVEFFLKDIEESDNNAKDPDIGYWTMNGRRWLPSTMECY